MIESEFVGPDNKSTGFDAEHHFEWFCVCKFAWVHETVWYVSGGGGGIAGALIQSVTFHIFC